MRPDGEEEAGGALMEGEDGLAIGAEEHEGGLPVPGGWRSAAAGRAAMERWGGSQAAGRRRVRRRPRLPFA